MRKVLCKYQLNVLIQEIILTGDLYRIEELRHHWFTKRPQPITYSIMTASSQIVHCWNFIIARHFSSAPYSVRYSYFSAVYEYLKLYVPHNTLMLAWFSVHCIFNLLQQLILVVFSLNSCCPVLIDSLKLLLVLSLRSGDIKSDGGLCLTDFK